MAIHITPAGTRGARVPNRGFLARVLRPMAELMVWVHRRSGGAQLSRMMGFPVVMLTTTGSKTGPPRTSPVGGFPDGDGAWLVVASLADWGVGSPQYRWHLAYAAWRCPCGLCR